MSDVDGSPDDLQARYDTLAKKFTDWKARAKSGVDQLRGQLDEAKAALAAEREAALAAQQAADERVTEAAQRATAKALESATARSSELRDRVASLEAEVVTLSEQKIAAEGAAAEAQSEAATSERRAREVSEARDAELSEQYASETAVTLENRAAQSSCIAGALATKLVVVRSAMVDALRVAATTALDSAEKLQAAHAARSSAETEARTAVEACESSKAELAALRAEYDKYKDRSSKALKLTTTGSDESKRQVAAAQLAERRAREQVVELEASIVAKDRTIGLIEDRFEQAMAQLAEAQREVEDLQDALDDARRTAEAQHGHGRSVSRARSTASREGTDDAVDDDFVAQAVNEAVAAADAEAESRLRDELENQAAAFAEEAQAKDVELVQLRVRLAQSQAKAGAAPASSSPSDDDAYVATLRKQLADARSASDTLRVERDQLNTQVRRLHAQLDAKKRSNALGSLRTQNRGGADAGDEPSVDVNQALAGMSADELRGQVLLKSEQLFDANQQIVQLRAALRTSSARSAASGGTGGGPRASDGGVDQQQAAYLRAVLINFFSSPNDEVRAKLVPILATLLHLSPDELRGIYQSNPDWIA